jgi:hypothetical protein
MHCGIFGGRQERRIIEDVPSLRNSCLSDEWNQRFNFINILVREARSIVHGDWQVLEVFQDISNKAQRVLVITYSSGLVHYWQRKLQLKS